MLRVGAAARIPLFTAINGAVPATKRLHLSIALAPRNPSGLSRLAAEVSTPGTPEYGHFLTVSQFAKRFGAAPASIAAIRRVLGKEGMSVAPATDNNLMISVTANASAVNRAMSARLSQVELPDGRRAYANLAAPSFQPAIAHAIEGVIGLDDVTPVESAGLVRSGPRQRIDVRSARLRAHLATGGPQPSCDFGSASNTGNTQNGYSYDQLAAAYGFSSLYGAGDLGQNQTVALVELEPYSSTDVQTFQACYGTSATVNQVDVNGGPSSDDDCSPGSGTCSDGESALDIETVIGLAPKATIDVYEGPDSAGIAEAAPVLNQIVSDDRAKVISTSFGVCEAATPGPSIIAENTALQEAVIQGQSFFSAAGDSGSETCSQLGEGASNFTEGLSVEDPAGQPFATGVGGTEMFTVSGGGANYDDTGASRSEVVWNAGTNPKCNCGGVQADGFGGGGGGGISSQWAMPSYQASASPALGVVGPDSAGAGFCGSGTCREVPDVSADAAGLTGYIVYTSDSGSASWATIAGTSAASPLWAAYMALVNADGTCRGLTIGFANPALYSLAGNFYGTDFEDVQATSTLASALNEPLQQISNNDTLYEWGVSGASDTSLLYPVTAGYDMATGLGSMQAGPLAAALCSLRSPVYSVSVASPGNQTSPTGKAVSLQVAGTDAGSGTTLMYSATGLPAGLAMSSTGAITGTPTTPGTSTVTVTASDQFTNAGSVQFSWTIVTPSPPAATGGSKKTVTPGPPAATGSLGGFKRGKVTLGLRLAAGSNAPALASVTLTLPKGLTFAKKSKSLKKGITLEAGSTKLAFKTSGGGGSLTLHFVSPEQAVTIAIGKSAIIESKTLEHKIDKHKTKQLKLVIIVTDAGGLSTRIVGTFKV